MPPALAIELPGKNGSRPKPGSAISNRMAKEADRG
jgi:hypothetical protein